ncbi:hypothetical protein BHE74_00024144 [Ensete ventricosum]|nr:hypothetical protein BHE74_00024144 [Ensete ventricosum]
MFPFSRKYFVNEDDTVPQKVSIFCIHHSLESADFYLNLKVYFEPEDVYACIVTCGGLCPGLNTVIREIVCGLSYMYGVKRIVGIQVIIDYLGFTCHSTVSLEPLYSSHVNDIHKRGGTILGTSRGGHDAIKIVYIIGGDGTQKGASVIFEVIDKSFGFDTAVEEAQRAINAAHVESESVENGIGVVKLMGQSPFYLEGRGGLFEYIEKRLKENGHMVIVVAEGAGQELIADSIRSMGHEDASGNKLLLDVGLWLSQKIKVRSTT